jgi:hypothetical protein
VRRLATYLKEPWSEAQFCGKLPRREPWPCLQQHPEWRGLHIEILLRYIPSSRRPITQGSRLVSRNPMAQHVFVGARNCRVLLRGIIAAKRTRFSDDGVVLRGRPLRSKTLIMGVPIGDRDQVHLRYNFPILASTGHAAVFMNDDRPIVIPAERNFIPASTNPVQSFFFSR